MSVHPEPRTTNVPADLHSPGITASWCRDLQRPSREVDKERDLPRCPVGCTRNRRNGDFLLDSRRLRSARVIKLSNIPLVVHELDDHVVGAVQLIPRGLDEHSESLARQGVAALGKRHRCRDRPSCVQKIEGTGAWPRRPTGIGDDSVDDHACTRCPDSIVLLALRREGPGRNALYVSEGSI